MSLSLVWTVLHMFELAVLLDIKLVSLRYVVCLRCFSSSVPGFLRHSHQTSLGVCEILVLGNPLLKSEQRLRRL